ncbi:MAG: TlpA family protein disulfide reductase [Planctomycetota bacterium]|jgi:hypothetical protein
MSGWQRMFEPLRKAGKIALVGIVQEQHADRARLYAQWKKIDWPILVDSLNLYGNRAVPIVMAVDEAGRIVHRSIRKKEQLEAFLKAPAVKRVAREHVAPDPAVRAYFDGDFDAAVAAFGKNTSAAARFRRGVALRARSESKQRQRGDAQRAVFYWQAALAMNPNQYIWRRRLQQYGPRLAKPYNFFGWVREARKEIEARGEKPVPLLVEPRGAELIDKTMVAYDEQPDRDPEGKIERDTGGFVLIESIVTPMSVRPGGRVRVRLLFRPGKAEWNNEGQGLTAMLKGPGFRVMEGQLVHPNAEKAHTGEMRTLECEVEIAKDAKPGTLKLSGYALYDVCVRADGTCLYRRQDLDLSVTVDPKAVKLGR